MKNLRRILLSAALLAIPAAGTAQLTGHVSIGIGLAAQTHPVFSPGFAVGLAPQSAHNGAFPGVGFSAGLGNSDYYDDDYGYGHHGGWDPYDCWDYLWYDPWFGCNRYYPVGHFGPWWDWHRPMWGFFGFLGWPSHRIVHHHWYGFSPFWYGGWGGYPGHYGWGWDRYRYRPPIRYVHNPYQDGGGYATPRGYRSGGRATPRGYTGGDRVVRASPLFGPRYKENPRKVYVTDNGPEKRVSRAVPRGTRTTPDTRRARPREGTKATTTRTAARPGTRTAVPTTRRTPTRTAKPVTTRSRRPAPKPKASAPRRPAPKPKASVPRRPAPKPKASAPRRSAPKPKASAPRRPAPKPKASARRRPAPKPKASAPRRPAAKPKASAPKRPAPKPKASAPKRPSPKPKAKPPSRGSGSSKKPPPRRGGKD